MLYTIEFDTVSKSATFKSDGNEIMDVSECFVFEVRPGEYTLSLTTVTHDRENDVVFRHDARAEEMVDCIKKGLFEK